VVRDRRRYKLLRKAFEKERSRDEVKPEELLRAYPSEKSSCTMETSIGGKVGSARQRNDVLLRMLSKGYGIASDYFAEALHFMRKESLGSLVMQRGAV
jgi:predicted ATP-dependent Lon-type protease